MTKRWTLTGAFAEFGVALANPRWSWSGRSADGKTVALTIWRDRLNYQSDPVSYDTFDWPAETWHNSIGNRERIRNIQWAVENCDGLFRVVITVAKDVNKKPREIAECYPQQSLVMKIVDFEEQSGRFRAIGLPQAARSI